MARPTNNADTNDSGRCSIIERGFRMTRNLSDPPPSPRRRTRLRWSTLALTAFSVVCAIATWNLFIAPSRTSVEDVTGSDAVVMFVGGRGERLETALQIIDADKANVLVIPNGTSPSWPAANELCDGRTDLDIEIVCLTPNPDTTRGEAQAIGTLATERGWTSLIMVTSTYHLERAGLLLKRCYEGEVIPVEAPPDLSPWSWGSRIIHEWAGTAQAQLLDRNC